MKRNAESIISTEEACKLLGLSRQTLYKLSEKGEDRLIYFWKKFNLLEPPLGWQDEGEKGGVEKELADERRSMCKKILNNQIERLKKNKPLRTPKSILFS